MVAIMLREPRPGTGGAKKIDFLRPGATVTLIGLTPEADASMAVLRWTNGEAKGLKMLAPADIEVVSLQELPVKPHEPGVPRRAPSGNSLRIEVDAAATRAAILAALPPGGPSPDSPVLLYWKDSLSGPGAHAGEGGEAAVEALQRSHDALKQALRGIPSTATGSVMSNAMSRTLGINSRNRRTGVALETARAVFPQAADRLRSVDEDVSVANALLVAAHVIGAGVVKHEAAEEGAARPLAAAEEEAGGGGGGGSEDMVTPSGRPRRKRVVTSYAESVSAGDSEGEGEAEVEEQEATEGSGEYRPPKEAKPARKRSRAKAPAKAPAIGAPAAPAQEQAQQAQQARPALQLQQAAGVPGLAPQPAMPAALLAGLPGGGVAVGPAPQLTPQQQQLFLTSYLWQLQQAMAAQPRQPGSPAAGGGLPASFPLAQALAQQPVLPFVGPAMGGGTGAAYGGFGSGAGGFAYPSAFGGLGAGGQQAAAAPAQLYGGLGGSWPQLGGVAALSAGDASAAASPAQFLAEESEPQGAAALPAEPAGPAELAATGEGRPAAAEQLAAEAAPPQQAGEQPAQAPAGQQAAAAGGLRAPGAGSVSDFLQ